MGRTRAGILYATAVFACCGCKFFSAAEDVDSDADSPVGDDLRIASIDFDTPNTLDNVIVEGLMIQESLDGLSTIWLIDMAHTKPTGCEFATGMGLSFPEGCVDDGCTGFILDEAHPRVEGVADCGDDGYRIPSGSDSIDRFDVPFRGGLRTVLPFRGLRVSVTRAAPGSFATGSIDAKISLEDALRVPIESREGDAEISSLGSILCRDHGDVQEAADDCQNVIACLAGEPPPDPEWNCETSGDPPDTDVAGAPAWSLVADFEAEWVEVVK